MRRRGLVSRWLDEKMAYTGEQEIVCSRVMRGCAQGMEWNVKCFHESGRLRR